MILFQNSEFRIQNFLVLVLALTPLPAFADSWTLVGADFQARPVNLLSLDAGGVKVSDADWPQGHLVEWSQVLELDHVLPPAASAADHAGAAAPFTLRLNGGDEVRGTPVSIADDKIIWRQPLLGEMEIPEDRAGAIVRSGAAVDGLDEPRKTDTVRLVNGDATSGVVQNLAGGAVTIQPGAADAGADAAGADAPAAEAARISLDKVAAILLADADPAASPVSGAGAAWRVWLSDGSSLTVPVAALAEGGQGKLTIGFSAQKTNGADLSAVSCIELLNGPVRWLTQLTPSAVVYHPYLERSFPPRYDHPVDDPTVSIRARFPSFRHGIGVHSYTRLTYAVPDGFGTFRTQFAIERIAGSDMAKADVTVRLLLDGKVAAEFTHVRYGPVADPVNLDVRNAKELALEVDYGDNLDAQDRFVWLDPAFVRQQAAAQK